MRNKVRTVLLDEDKKSREAIAAFLLHEFTQIEIAGEASNLKSAQKILGNPLPDLVLSETVFRDGTLFDLLGRMDEGCFRIIFITSSASYALQALNIQAAGYLIKPVEPVELTSVVHKALEDIRREELFQSLVRSLDSSHDPQQNKKITLKTAESIYVITLKDITHCESDRSYSKFYMTDGKMIMVSKPLKEYEGILCENSFVRTHKSYLVNFNFIERFDRSKGGSVVLKNGEVIPVAYRKKNDLLNMFRLISP